MKAARAWPVLLAAILVGCMSMMGSSLPREGAQAPPTDGTDGAGQPLNLQSHRGKVVMLSFWHSGCYPCRQMFPHEKAMVERFAGKPFVLLGVNADAKPERLQETQQKDGLTWVSWWDGASGPIAAAWGVDLFPSFFVIDKQGVVRLKHTGKPPPGMLESKIEQLLQEKADSPVARR